MTIPEGKEPEGAQEPKPEGQVPIPASESGKSFTQEEINQMMGRVRSEERAKYSDYSRLKERAQKADELEAANLSEKEKLERKVAEADRRAIDADARIADTAIRAEVRMRAVQKGIVDPDAAYALIDRTDIAYSDDEGVTGVDAALDTLLTNKSYLKAPNAVAPNLNPEGVPAQAPVKLTDAQREAAKRHGVKEEDYAKYIRQE